jgi:hypothetical protein
LEGNLPVDEVSDLCVAFCLEGLQATP